jgi:hypothetical protein
MRIPAKDLMPWEHFRADGRVWEVAGMPVRFANVVAVPVRDPENRKHSGTTITFQEWEMVELEGEWESE